MTLVHYNQIEKIRRISKEVGRFSTHKSLEYGEVDVVPGRYPIPAYTGRGDACHKLFIEPAKVVYRLIS